MTSASEQDLWRSLINACILRPREGMRRVLELRMTHREIWMFFVAVTAANTVAETLIWMMLKDQVIAAGFALDPASPFSMMMIKASILLVVALSLNRFSFDVPDRTERFYHVLMSLTLYRAVGTLSIFVCLVLLFVSFELALLVLVVTQIYLVWLVTSYASVALGDMRLGSTFILLFISVIVGMILFLFVLVVLTALFG